MLLLSEEELLNEYNSNILSENLFMKEPKDFQKVKNEVTKKLLTKYKNKEVKENEHSITIKGITVRELTEYLKTLNFEPAKYGVSRSYGYDVEQLNLYRELSDGTYISISLYQNNHLSNSDTNIIFSYTSRKHNI